MRRRALAGARSLSSRWGQPTRPGPASKAGPHLPRPEAVNRLSGFNSITRLPKSMSSGKRPSLVLAYLLAVVIVGCGTERQGVQEAGVV